MKKIFAVGDITLDILCSVNKQIDFGAEAHLNNLTFSLGGNAANFAFAASKMGLNIELLSPIGNDFATPFVTEQLRSAGVKLNLKKFNGTNACSIIMVGKNGRRAIYSRKGVLEKISSRDIEKMLLPKLKQGDIVFFGAYFHMPGMRKGFKKLLEKICAKNCFIVFDTCYDAYGRWKILGFLKYFHILFINEIELRKVTKKKDEEKAVAVLFRNGASLIVLKKGARGSKFFAPDIAFSAKAAKAQAIDTTGAGDVFNAAFLLAFLSGVNEKKALGFANFVAAKKTEKHGLFVPAKKVLKGKLVNR
ncbi:MAG: carbohydrate kinase family protein [Candidatus Diapherotrites archaeon]|nr:carbohydrate kinase family protein [Candidatus Diapherotrites archaeon]